MYYTLPVKDRMQLMKHYKQAYPGMSYSEMVEHFNNGGIVPESGYEPVGKYPSVPNADGTSSNEITMSIGTDDGSYVIPTMWEGKKHTQDEAYDRFSKTGLHMGKFANDKDAERGAQLREFINNNVAPYSQKPQQYGDGGKVQLYKPKSQEDFDYRDKMYNDSLSAYNFGEYMTKKFTEETKIIKNKNIPITYKKGTNKTPYAETNMLPYTSGSATWKSEDQSKQAHNLLDSFLKDLGLGNVKEDDVLLSDVKFARWKKPEQKILPYENNNKPTSTKLPIKPVQQVLPPKSNSAPKPKLVNTDTDYMSKLNVSKEYEKKYPRKPGYITRPATKEELDKGIIAVDIKNSNYKESKLAIGKEEQTMLPTDNPRYGMIMDYSGKWIPADSRQKQYGVSDDVMKFNNLPTGNK